MVEPQPSTSQNKNPATNTPKVNKIRKVTLKPMAVLDYNKVKLGIDLSDQIASYGTTLRKGINWYRKLGLELLLGITMVNAWVVYKHATKKKIKIRTFREELVTQILQVQGLEQHEQPKSIVNVYHLEQSIDPNGKKIRRKCSKCFDKIQKETGCEEARKS